MANHKSSEKRILITIKKNAVNTARKSAVKTSTKKVLKAIEAGDKATATEQMRKTESLIMKAACKIMPKKRAARKVSRMTQKVSKLK